MAFKEQIRMLRGPKANLGNLTPGTNFLRGMIAIAEDSKEIYSTDGVSLLKLGQVVITAGTTPAVAEQEKLWVDTAAGTLKTYNSTTAAWEELIGFIESDINATPSTQKAASTQYVVDKLTSYYTISEVDSHINRIDTKNADQDTRLTNLETETGDAKESTVKGVDSNGDGVIEPKVFTSVDARLEDIEQLHVDEVGRAKSAEDNLQTQITSNDGDISNLQTEQGNQGNRITAVENELDAAHGTAFVDLKARLDDSDTRLNTETTDRKNADANLQSQIDSNDLDISALQSDKANLSGAIFTGDVQVPNTPATDASAVNKSYIDSLSTGLAPKEGVRVASTAAIADLSGDVQSGTSYVIDGVALQTGDRVLVKDGASPDGVAAISNIYNGGYEVTITLADPDGVAGSGDETATAVYARVADMDSSAEIEGAHLFVAEGTANADVSYYMNADNVTLGTSDITFVAFSSSAIKAESGLYKTGNEIGISTGGVLDSHIGLGTIKLDKLAVDVATQVELNSHISNYDATKGKIGASFVGVDETNIADGAILQYDSVAGVFRYTNSLDCGTF